MWVIALFEAVYIERNAVLAGALVPVGGDHVYVRIYM